MAGELVKQLIDSGIHFGHRVSRWNPKMQPYIYGRRNLIHIINVKETLRGVLLAQKFLARVVSEGKDVLLVGTKRQARKAVEENAKQVGMHWVNDRWLGGALTNFREIRKRVGRLEELEQMEADGLLDAYSKKQGASLRREMRKIRRNLGGIRRMEKLPGAMFVVDQRREIIAVREARKLGIPVICLLDTDSDPDLVDIPIPGNDDAMRGIELIVRHMCEAISVGLRGRSEADEQEPQAAGRRRSQRATTARAEEQPPAAETAQAQEPSSAPDLAGAPAQPAEPPPSPPAEQTEETAAETETA